MSGPAFIPLGRVVKPHGLKGELSVKIETGVELPTGLEVWFVPPSNTARTGRIEATRQGPKGLLVKVTGIDDVDTASELAGTELVARPEDLPPDHPHPAPDVTGLFVSDITRGELGPITDVIHTGANDVWVLAETPFGEILIPVIDDVVLEIDHGAGTCLVRLLPGLVED